ncbi:nitrite reductase small subunit NirD [Nocardioides sp. ChNu-99]|uniref:nitrite reductase small subunit NirD n=1 Tax=Nocardioides sp. ChNu-99 TaxID=2839897 RepID=UPI002406459A|nr:nitrite reductase small subunit NirD [Nocardioides sp. ChNu-99]MDF9714914.1 nitrite reductase small subunit NirD [Nocardioides sp. ChNu-99]
MTPTTTPATTATTTWTPVCATDRLGRERGVAALVAGRAVAVFRTYDDEWFALDNHCPFARASVLARGIVGTRGDVPFVASPMLKQPFGLRDGVCLDDPDVRVATYPVRVVDGVVEVGTVAGTPPETQGVAAP